MKVRFDFTGNVEYVVLREFTNHYLVSRNGEPKLYPRKFCEVTESDKRNCSSEAPEITEREG